MGLSAATRRQKSSQPVSRSQERRIAAQKEDLTKITDTDLQQRIAYQLPFSTPAKEGINPLFNEFIRRYNVLKARHE